jgi:uncharacterized NAD(P)/FAD-binding protein YdhS
MSIAQRRRFLRHGRAYWDVLLHRTAPEAESRIKALRASGKLEIVAGRVVHAEERKDGIAVQILRRSRRQAQTDPLGIGLDISDEYALIDRWSRSSNRVRAVGPLARATFRECTAIPDIRMQCKHLAEIIARNSAL